MASIFNFEPDPPQVSSPWSTPRTSTPRLGVRDGSSPLLNSVGVDSSGVEESGSGVIVTSLAAEPQDGPTEYKLHLLLRQRRQFIYSSTAHKSTTALRGVPMTIPRAVSESYLQTKQGSTINVPSLSKQQRLEQLTTQLLWRLQQSSSYHDRTYSTSHSHPVISGAFEDAAENNVVSFPELGDSKGALYEIGVADDGTFVGLAEDELEDSLDTLGRMAARLGCNVSIVRKVRVGECKWLEHSSDDSSDTIVTGTLWVAEAYIRPNSAAHVQQQGSVTDKGRDQVDTQRTDIAQPRYTEQLRVTLTGATASGKTSLLGILTTNTLDDGRGKSRLNLLRHQHEQLTGLTSSVTQELLGYSESRDENGSIQVYNFMPERDICSWVDIHAKCEGGRLISFFDSAGHPRFRRTTVRGLMGCSPNWTLLCLPADNDENTKGRPGSTPPAHETLGTTATDIDLSEEHLNLCLQLRLPLVLVITKQDLASRTGLRSYLNKTLSTLKRFDRQPVLITETGTTFSETESPVIYPKDLADLSRRLPSLDESPDRVVPIVLTSSVTGAGIKTLHALLYTLPIPSQPTLEECQDDGCDSPLFDIEDIYRGKSQAVTEGSMIILSGLVRRGQISIGDELLVGPFHGDPVQDSNPITADIRQLSIPGFRSLSGVSPPPLAKSASSSRPSPGFEWCKVVVCSARHLRLPARTLLTNQVGTLGVMPVDMQHSLHLATSIRKGMVVTVGTPFAQRTFTGRFLRSDVDNLTIGSTVVVYFNSVRASARIIAGSIVTEEAREESARKDSPAETEGFAFQFDSDELRRRMSDTEDLEDVEQLLVTFQFIASKEYVEVGSTILVMPGGGFGVFKGSTSRGERGVGGLSGFVGEVVDAVEVRRVSPR